METSNVRRRVREAVANAKRSAAERRTRIDEASRAWAAVLERIVIPLARQVAQALAAESVRLQVSTPGDRVLIGSEHRPDEYVELALETSGDEAAVIARVIRPRASVTDERVLVRGAEAIGALDEDRALDAILDALKPFVGR